MKTPSLNHAYRLVWSHVLNAWVAVSEATKGHGKSRSGKRLLKRSGAALAASALFLSPTLALADQTGGTVVSGVGSISQSANVTNINQSSQTLGLTWDTFNINANQTVNFVQPNAAALAVNRIFDTNGSKIMGNLNANGQVWLINPNGVFFGAGSQVNVGSILASTLNPLSNTGDADQIFGNGGSGSVINQGNITAANGGYVAMLGNKVINEGVITAQMGTVALGAGSKVSLQFNGNQLLGLTIDESTLNNLAENKQLVKADGGAVFMSAGAKDSILASMVNNTGVIEAQTVQNQDGKIILLGGMTAGTTNVDGTLDASAATADNTGAADGGFIETSAAHVKVADDAVVTTNADNGQTGTWLIDPVDFTVAATGGDMTGAAATTALASNNLTILSTSGASGTAGDININDAITWGTNNNLTLNALNDININQEITATGATAKLNLLYGQANVAAGNTSTYNVDAKVNLHAGDNFSTKLGSDGTVKEYKVITELGAAGSTTGTDLQGINGNLSGNYVLGADIDASGTSTWNSDGAATPTYAGFNPLGDDVIFGPLPAFTGRFDGLGHTVNNLTIDRPSETDVGLFGVTSSASIQNIGLVGGAVTGSDWVGGLVGFSNNTTISNAYATGAVTGHNYVGGLAGGNQNTTITNAYATGDVSGNNDVGGLVGYSAPYSTISNAYATGAVSGNNRVGGLVGDYNNSTITNGYATGAVTGNINVGGLVGENDNSTITNGYYADTTGQIDTGKGEKKTIADLAKPLSDLGFDDKVWGNGNNQTTPYLLSHGIFDTAGQVYLGTDPATPTTPLTPYQAIINVNQLQAVNKALSSNYVLGNNIDASGTNTWNAGAGFDPLGSVANSFTGNFDGLGHTVNSLTINRTAAVATNNNVGLFGHTGNTAMIRNVSLNAASIKGYNSVGGLVGYNKGSISNASVTGGSVTGNHNVGGLVGLNYGSISTAHTANTTVSGGQYVGGLVGTNFSSISNTYATGNVTGVKSGANTGDDIGGLAGRNLTSSASISNSYATGFVSAGSTSAGGDNVGGLVGYNEDATIKDNSYATGNAQGNETVGGLVGQNKGGKIIDSHAEGTAKADHNAGGLVGYNGASTNGASIVSSYATGNIIAGYRVGGLVGANKDSTITQSYATGTVTGTYTTHHGTGGLVGQSGGSTSAIIQSYATGNVNGTSKVGGLVGLQESLSIINSAYATGNVSGSGDNVGGLVGHNSYSTINNAYATGDVNATGTGADAGGLVGFNETGVINTAYATGNVNATGTGANTGGLVGRKIGSSTISNGYYADTTGQNDIGKGEKKTIEQLAAALPTGFSSADWGNGDNQTTPYLLSHGVFDTAGPVYLGTDAAAANPYQAIINVNQLQAVNKALSANYVLGNNIDASGTSTWNSDGAATPTYAGFNPIGDNTTKFTGTFDGLGHTVNDLTINRPTSEEAGLFGDNEGTIKNVGVVDASITGGKRVGGLAGRNHGDIDNSYATGSVSGLSATGDYIGGLVGYNYSASNITNSYATSTVIGGRNYSGGLAGRNSGSIQNSYATGSVSAGTDDAGGLVGRNSGSIENSYATGAVSITGTGTDIGGLVGNNSGTVTNGYYANTTGQSDDTGKGKKKSIAELAASLSDLGFDDTKWGNGDNQTTPYLLSHGVFDTAGQVYLGTDPATTAAALTPYQAIINVNQLQAVNKALSSNYVLGNNIDASNTSTWNAGAGFNPLGNDSTRFTGTFDGLGHTVNGLSIRRELEDYVGLFGATDSATIQNIGLISGVTLKGYAHVGWLVGHNKNSTISNAYATGKISGRTDVGGLVGNNENSTISNAYATSSVVGTSRIGGLVGNNKNSTISNAYATGSVRSRTAGGGLVGNNENSTISNAYAIGSVNGDDQVGGLVGDNKNGSKINYSFATGKVTATGSDGGGLVGKNDTGATAAFVNDSYYADTTNQNDNTGKGEKKTIAQLAAALPTGFSSANWGNGTNQTTPYLLSHGTFDTAGPVYLGTDTAAAKPYQAIINVDQLQAINKARSRNYVLGNDIDASATSTWNAFDNAGTIAYKGFNPLSNNINYFTGKLDGLGHTVNDLTINRPSTNYVGLFGFIEQAKIQNIGLIGVSVTGNQKVGGLVGQSNNYSTIKNVYAIGNVTGKEYVGGLVGDNQSSTIHNAYTAGNVSNNASLAGFASWFGGLAGENAGLINNAYSTANVSADSTVGGLVGFNWNTGIINNTYASGDVTFLVLPGISVGHGGLVASNQAGGIINNSFWNTQTSNEATSDGGTGKTTAEMQTLSTFANAGWDIDDAGGTGKIWRIYEGHTSPLLRNFMTQLDLTGNNQATTYDGTTQSIAYTLPAGTDASLVLGSTSGKNAGTHNRGLYSIQQGYDIAESMLTIAKATLTYVATPNTMTAGTTPNLTGNVTGFVGGESLASATTGGLLWNTAGNTTQPGTYDITGSGLSALNYNFVQDAANATALTVQAGSIPQPILTTVNSALPSGTPTPTQTQVTTIDVNNPLTASGGEEGESGFINDPQSQSQVIDIVYNSCDPDKDCDKDDTP